MHDKKAYISFSWYATVLYILLSPICMHYCGHITAQTHLTGIQQTCCEGCNPTTPWSSRIPMLDMDQ